MVARSLKHGKLTAATMKTSGAIHWITHAQKLDERGRYSLLLWMYLAFAQLRTDESRFSHVATFNGAPG
jgi:hypothetical protein